LIFYALKPIFARSVAPMNTRRCRWPTFGGKGTGRTLPIGSSLGDLRFRPPGIGPSRAEKGANVDAG
jgi:hypothetical protein